MSAATGSVQNPSSPRCLIIACTQSKREGKCLPALHRYDGPTFRVLRKFIREADPQLVNIDIYVLSARYGLIPATYQIDDYDIRMTEERAQELRDRVLKAFQEILGRRYDEVLIALSTMYMHAVRGYEAHVPQDTKVTTLSATRGRQLSLLKSWLYKTPVPTRSPNQRIVEATGSTVLRGVSIKATPEEVKALGRRALDQGKGDPSRFRRWYTLIDGEKVSTKWLASQLSGLDVSEFDASESRRVLQRLGIDVYHED